MIAQLPVNWMICTVADLAELIRGVTYKKVDARQDKAEGFVPLLRSHNINQTINLEKLIYIRKNRVSSSQWLKKFDVLIAMSSGSADLVGKAAQLESPKIETFGAFCGVLRPLPKINQKFFGYFFQTQNYRRSISEEAKGSNINNLKRSHILDTKIPLPPLNEQRRIVEKIETLFARLDAGEAALKKVQTLLARYRQSVLKAAVTGELTQDWRAQNAGRVESGHDLLQRILKTRRDHWQGRGKYKEPIAPDTSGLPELPEGWAWATVEQVATDVDYGSSEKCSLDTSGIPVLRMGNIVDGILDFSELKYLPEHYEGFPKLFLKSGDLLFNRTNSAELVGKTAVYQGQVDRCSFASYLIRVRLMEVVPEFLSAFINSAFGRQWIRNVVSQQVGQANVNGSKLKALEIPLPPAEEQLEIRNRLNQIFSAIGVIETICHSELARSKALRQSILKQAFAGRLVSQDPNDEPASELLARIRAECQSTSDNKRRRSSTLKKQV